VSLINKSYIFGHRGFMGKYIENTMEGFKKAVSLGVGIESDVQLTKDGQLVCFHDSSFKIEKKWYKVSKLTLEEMRDLPFPDKRIIPTVYELLQTFKERNSDLRYSFDIRSKAEGVKLINLISKFNLLDRVEITDKRISVLTNLRNYSKLVNLVYTVPENLKHIKKEVELGVLKDLKINTLNIFSIRANSRNLKDIIDNNFNCYVWNVNYKLRMKKVFSFSYKNEYIKAIYTDFPDRALKIRRQL